MVPASMTPKARSRAPESIEKFAGKKGAGRLAKNR